MREIKFRAWDEYFGEIQYAEQFELKFEMDNNCIAGGFSDNGEYYEKKLMQYTGLKDKNGLEIYEGDIINCFNDVYEIRWHENMCCFVGYMEDGDYEMFDYVLKLSLIHVIGNIYENKELLNE